MNWRTDKERTLSWAISSILAVLLAVLGFFGARLQAQVDEVVPQVRVNSERLGNDHEAILEIRERSRVIEQDVKDLVRATNAQRGRP